MSNVQLGLGLIGIGRIWGHTNAVIPSENDALALLSYAKHLGIRYFDTAPSYGKSEERLGKFLATLSSEERSELIIATKFGEHWNREKEEAYVDQSFAELKRSLDQSLSLLRKVDVLYLHKATLDVLKSNDVTKGIEYAKSLGVEKLGASVSDVESAEFVCDSSLYSVIQFPYNLGNRKFADIIELAKQKNKTVVINRPFGMGDLLYAEEYKNLTQDKLKKGAYEFILKKDFTGFILTGTKDKMHLKANVELFLNLTKSKQNS